jgi:DNA gyrase subunit A
MIITNEGTLIRTPVSEINIFGSNTSGVKVMRIEGETKIVKFAAVKSDEEEDKEIAEAAEEAKATSPVETIPTKNTATKNKKGTAK